MGAVRDQYGTELENLSIVRRGSRKIVVAGRPIRQGATLVRMQGELLESPDIYSIQIAVGKHLGKGGLIDDEMNHRCKANAKIEFSDLVIVAKTDIAAGEEVCLNYCATEDIVAAPFRCSCGSVNCYGLVRGFHFLSKSQQRGLIDDLSPFLRQTYGY